MCGEDGGGRVVEYEGIWEVEVDGRRGHAA